jgi:uncharacterized protein (TIGR03067 family)
MCRPLWFLVTAGLLLAADAPRDEAAMKDLERMQGDWAADSYVQDGMEVPRDDAQALFRTVKGNAYTVFRFSKAIGKGTFTLDATKRPRAIEARPAAAKGAAPPPVLGIYELDGDTLKLCFAAPGKERPAAFTSPPGSGHVLSVWKREKKEPGRQNPSSRRTEPSKPHAGASGFDEPASPVSSGSPNAPRPVRAPRRRGSASS